MKFARLAFNLPLFQEFDYKIPDELGSWAKPGSRALVFFRGVRQIGIILSTSELTEYEGKLGSLIKILDPFPLLKPSQLSLGGFISKNYHCPIGVTLSAMIPSGIKLKGDPSYNKTSLEVGKEGVKGFSPEHRTLLDLIPSVGEGDYSLGQLCQKFRGVLDRKKIKTLLSDLSKRGVIFQTGLSSNGSVDFKKVIHYKKVEIAPEIFSSLKGSNQKKIMELVCTQGELTPEIIGKFFKKNPASSLKTLVEMGLLQKIEVDSIRLPGSEAFYSRGDKEDKRGSEVVLSPQQKKVLNQIETGETTRPFLLYGVTCSGKTEVYLKFAEDLLKKGKRVIILVPEISLTPQIGRRFTHRFGPVVAFNHSGLTPRERLDQWLWIYHGGAKVIVGARSALFAPVSDLGGIIMDEEGDPSYKQDNHPRYHAREVAVELASLHGASLIMGSATPSLETTFRAKAGRYQYLEMGQSYFGGQKPKIEIVNMADEFRIRFNKAIFSKKLIELTHETLNNGRQLLLFLNKRGFSSFVVCRDCGERIQCKNCKVSLCWHKDLDYLLCHLCHYKIKIPKECPSCQSLKIRQFGAGTQRVEEEARKHWPNKRIMRMDSDQIKDRKDHERFLNQMEKGEVDILIGTQMIARGLDFPNIGMVGVVSADVLINLPDFRANERTFSLLDQVVGRSGRGNFQGVVVVQTYHPDHYALTLGTNQDYPSFYEKEMEHRKNLFFPPFSFLAQLKFSGRNQLDLLNFAKRGGEILKILIGKFQFQDEVTFFGPAPAPIERALKDFRYLILLKSPTEGKLEKILKEFQKNLKTSASLHYTVDVDPYNFS